MNSSIIFEAVFGLITHEIKKFIQKTIKINGNRKVLIRNASIM